MNKNKIWWSLLLLSIILFFDPINRGITRYSLVAILAILTFYTLFMFWKNIYIRALTLSLITITSLIFLMPSEKVETEILRNQYITELTKFEGSGYLWGGESKMGIDCSGLVRRGMIDANLKLGLYYLKPQLIKNAVSLWFYDSAADALMNGYRDTTKYVSSVKDVNNMDYSSILPGDFMVTQNGVHTMAYIGNQTWIEADPSLLKVVKIKVPENKLMWFKVPAKIIRWQQLS